MSETDTSDGRSDQDRDTQLASSLRIAVMRLSRRLRAERSDETLGLSQLSALTTLDHAGPLSPTALADREHIQPPSITRVIAMLEARGLVERKPHPSDRRQAVIALTESGQALVAEDRRRRAAWLAKILDRLSEDDRERLRAALSVLERLSTAETEVAETAVNAALAAGAPVAKTAVAEAPVAEHQ